MRVKAGKYIDLCKSVVNEGGRILFIYTVGGRRWRVDCGSSSIAMQLCNKMFVEGYADISNLNYTE